MAPTATGVATESDVVVFVVIEVAKGNSFLLRCCCCVCCLLLLVVVVEGFVLWNRPLLVLDEKEFASWLNSSIVEATNDAMNFILFKLMI
jgi:hypothetical protein